MRYQNITKGTFLARPNRFIARVETGGEEVVCHVKNTGRCAELLRPGDCLVLNNSRVLPARLLGHRVPTGGAVEVLLLRDKGEGVWECLTKPGRKTHTGTELSFGDGDETHTASKGDVLRAQREDGTETLLPVAELLLP